MRALLTFGSVALLLAGTLAYADDTEVATTPATPATEDDGRRPGARSKRESWYTYWGLGYNRPFYPASTQPAVNAIRDTPNITGIPLSLDLLGLYLPLNPDFNGIVGVIVNASTETWSSGFTSSAIYTYLYSASYMHFFGPEVGEGFFARADLGAARGAALSNYTLSSISNWGYGFLAGAGYGVGVSDGTRVLVHLNFTMRSIQGEGFSAIQVNFGGLF